ncbi:MAG: GNAT family N-acetyltransferase [Armatimonadetes bacterium]|nr:GNAT family N-acetyltransferase [Armatimonadota bacterium]
MDEPRRITDLAPAEWAHLAACCEAEGLRIVSRLLADFASAANRFDRPGEILLASRHDGAVVACVGLNVHRDPVLGVVGRVRRLYVDPAWRGQGTGRKLVRALMAASASRVDVFIANAGRLPVGGFYERLGFESADGPGLTHMHRPPSTPSTPSP